MLAPPALDEWVGRWGPSAHPLVWSHGMFLGALGELNPDVIRSGRRSPQDG